MARRGQHPYVNEIKRLYSEGRCDRREFLRTATLLGLSAAAAYRFAGVAEAQTNPATNIPRGGTARIGVRLRQIESAHKNNFVPPSNVLRQVCEYLTKTGYDNVTRPHLLEKWTPSDDLRTCTLTLRRDVKWHSGRAFTADDVVWNLKQVLDPKTGSSVLGLMKGFIMEEYETGEKDDKGNPKKSSR